MKRRNLSNFLPIQAPNPAIRRCFGIRRVINHHLSAFGTDFSLCGRPSPTQNSRHACQVVSRKGKSRLGPHLGQSSESDFSQPTHGLGPTKYFLERKTYAVPSQGERPQLSWIQPDKRSIPALMSTGSHTSQICPVTQTRNPNPFTGTVLLLRQTACLPGRHPLFPLNPSRFLPHFRLLRVKSQRASLKQKTTGAFTGRIQTTRIQVITF